MNRWTLALAIVFASSLSLAVAQTDMMVAPAPATQPAGAKAAKPMMAADPTKVTGVYAKLDGLSADQKTKIAAVQAELKEKVRKAEEEADTKIDAMLTPEQQAQLDTLEGDKKQKNRDRAKNYREKLKTGAAPATPAAPAAPAAPGTPGTPGTPAAAPAEKKN
jgi:Skp family chaperone for outer membrane proteins